MSQQNLDTQVMNQMIAYLRSKVYLNLTSLARKGLNGEGYHPHYEWWKNILPLLEKNHVQWRKYGEISTLDPSSLAAMRILSDEDKLAMLKKVYLEVIDTANKEANI